MKRLAFLAGLFAFAALAGTDTEPWEAVNTQKEFKKPVQFDREVFFASIDAGPSNFDSIVTPNLKVDVFDAGSGIVNGVLQVGTLKAGTIDAGNELVNGQLQVTGAIVGATETLSGTLGVTGVTTLLVLDAGVKSRVGGVTIASGSAQDGGTQTPLMQWGYAALSSSEIAVTFTRAFTANPSCVCSHTQTTNANACGVKTGTAPSTTACTFAVASGGSDVIFWQCMGDQ